MGLTCSIYSIEVSMGFKPIKLLAQWVNHGGLKPSGEWLVFLSTFLAINGDMFFRIFANNR